MTTALAQRANERLTAWLRESDDGTALDVVYQIKEAVEHLIDCDGKDHECAWTNEECAGGKDCAHCTSVCQDCDAYRNGTTGYFGTRAVFDLLAELGKRIERRESVA